MRTDRRILSGFTHCLRVMSPRVPRPFTRVTQPASGGGTGEGGGGVKHPLQAVEKRTPVTEAPLAESSAGMQLDHLPPRAAPFPLPSNTWKRVSGLPRCLACKHTRRRRGLVSYGLPPPPQTGSFNPAINAFVVPVSNQKMKFPLAADVFVMTFSVFFFVFLRFRI